MRPRVFVPHIEPPNVIDQYRFDAESGKLTPNDPPLLTALLYVLLGYLVYVALRFALEPRTRREFEPYDPYAAGDVGAPA